MSVTVLRQSVGHGSSAESEFFGKSPRRDHERQRINGGDDRENRRAVENTRRVLCFISEGFRLSGGSVCFGGIFRVCIFFERHVRDVVSLAVFPCEGIGIAVNGQAAAAVEC